MDLKKKLFIGLGLAILILAAIYGFSFLRNQSQKNTSSLQKEDANTSDGLYEWPAPVRPTGVYSYAILQNGKITPAILSIKLNPVNPAPGTTQKISVVTKSLVNVKSLTLRAISLFGSKNIELLNKGPTPPGDIPKPNYSIDADNHVVFSAETATSTRPGVKDLYTSFEGEFIIPTDKDIPVQMNFVLKDANGRLNTVFLDWRATCRIPNSADWTSRNNCNISYVGGADGANEIIGGIGVTLDSALVINKGKNISLVSGGKIAIGEKGSIVESNIWVPPSDKTGTGRVASENSSGSGYKRQSDFKNPPGSDIAPQKPSPQSTYLLPQGTQVYQVVQAAEVWPKILQMTVDPPDVHVGQTQTFSIVVQGPDAISSVEAQIETDNGVRVLPLNLTGPTASAELLPMRYYVDSAKALASVETVQQDGDLAEKSFLNTLIAHADDYPRLTYSGSWKVSDTHDKKYTTTFVVKDVTGRVNKDVIAWSDACSIPQSGAWNLKTTESNCTINLMDGVMNGDATIRQYTLTLNDGFAWSPGYSLPFVGTGQINISTNGYLQQGTIYYTDSDTDGYANSLSSDSSICFEYTISGGGLFGCEGTTRAILNSYTTADCYDSNANANPGQGSYMATDRGDGNYDYNCDHVETQMSGGVADADCDPYTCQWGTAGVYSAGWCDNVGQAEPPYIECSSSDVPACGATGNSAIAGGCEIPGKIGTCHVPLTSSVQYCI